jgi:hypothetical protein
VVVAHTSGRRARAGPCRLLQYCFGIQIIKGLTYCRFAHIVNFCQKTTVSDCIHSLSPHAENSCAHQKKVSRLFLIHSTFFATTAPGSAAQHFDLPVHSSNNIARSPLSHIDCRIIKIADVENPPPGQRTVGMFFV